MPSKANDALVTLEIIEVMEAFLQRIRPPEEIRSKLDIAYRVEGRDIYICEVRPRWDLPEVYVQNDAAKATYVKSHNQWKVFWLRASGKWESYPPQPVVKSLAAFVKLVEEDKHHCFWG